MARWRNAILVKDAATVIALDMTFRQAPERYTPALAKSAETDGNERVRAFSTRVLGKLKNADEAAALQAPARRQEPLRPAERGLGAGRAAERRARPAVAELQRASRSDPANDVRAAAKAALGKALIPRPNGPIVADKPKRKPTRPAKKAWQKPAIKSGQAVRVEQPRLRQERPGDGVVRAVPQDVMRARVSTAPSTLTLSIGGLVGHLELEGAHPAFLEQLRARYGAFELPDGDWVARDFSLRLALDPLAAARRLGGEAARADGDATARGDGGRRGRSPPVAGTSRSGWLRRSSRGRIAYRGEGRCEVSPFAVDCVLRVLFATLLPRVGGMLIHGCGLRHAEIGVVFPGVSGAGKTTLARKAPDADDVLSDEIVAVRRLDDGWRVFGTPVLGRLRARRHLDAQLAAAHASPS